MWIALLSLPLACRGEPSLSDDELAALERSKEEIGENWTGTMLYDHPDNPFLQEIPSDYEVHENSSEMIELIKSQTGTNFSNTNTQMCIHSQQQ